MVKDHEVTRQFYEGVLGLPLVAVWSEAERFAEFPDEDVHYCHAFYGLGDGSALAFFQFADPAIYATTKAATQSGFNHLALSVTAELQEALWARLDAAGYTSTFIDHGYFRSVYVRDPDEWYLEFTCDASNADAIDRWQTRTAHATLASWLAGDHEPNNTYRPHSLT